MKKLTKALISSVCAVSMLAGSVISASACDLTAEELFEKYSFAYMADWESNYGYFYVLMYSSQEDDVTYYDADGNETNDIFSASYIKINEYCYETPGGGMSSRVYTCEYEDGFYYAIKDDGTVVIAGCDYDYMNEHSPTELLIPERIGGAVVTEIARAAFDNLWQCYKEDLTHVLIPDTVEIIRCQAFYHVFPFYKEVDCSINVPKNIKYLGGNAYGGDTALALGDVIVLPECTEFINNYAFGTNLPMIQMPESLVFTDYPTIGGGRFLVNRNEPYDKKEAEYFKNQTDVAFVDGKYNTVTLFDLRKYLLEKTEQQKPAGTLIAGDLNADGEIELSDAVLLSRAVSGSYELSAEARAAADLSGDNAVDAADLAILMNLLAGN